MRRLFWYLLQQFAIFWAGLVVGCALLLVVYRLMENLHALRNTGGLVDLLWVVIQIVVLAFAVEMYQIIPVASLFGWLLLLERLRFYNEEIAIFCMGTNPRWVGAVGISGAIVAAFIQAAWGGWVVPDSTVRLRELERRIARRAKLPQKAPRQGVWYRGPQGIYYVGGVSPRGDHFGPFTLWRFRDNGSVQQRVDSQRILFSAAQGWQGQKVWLRTIGPGVPLQVQYHLRWPMDLQATPQMFRLISGKPDEFSLSDLQRVVRLRRSQGREYRSFAVAFWQRLFFPLVGPLLLALATALVLGGPPQARRRRASMSLSLSLGLVLSFCGWFLGSFGQALAQGGRLSPLAGSLIPLLVISFCIPVVGTIRARCG